MLTSAELVYLDSSALVKLVVPERESAHLVAYLRDRSHRASSALARVEVVRAVRVYGADAVARARRVLDELFLVRLDVAMLDAAAEADPRSSRTLDAIHLGAARSLGDELARLVTYDHRMAAAAREVGLVVDSPGA